MIGVEKHQCVHIASLESQYSLRSQFNMVRFSRPSLAKPVEGNTSKQTSEYKLLADQPLEDLQPLCSNSENNPIVP